MCGIAGIYSAREDTALSSKRLTAALKLISHRGPDDLKYITSDNVFSGGAVRLSIEALRDGAQPIQIGNLTVGFNGEIFNYKQLAKEYGLGASSTTSEVRFLLDAWSQRGSKIFNDLDGQFAIYIYDSKKKELVLARDPFGIRPIFYTSFNGGFYFCSEIKGVFKLTNNDFPFDEVGIASIAMLWTTVGDRTIFENIKQVKRGHYVSISPKGVVDKSYYRDPLFLTNQKTFSNRNDAVDFLRHSLKNSVHSQVHGEVGYASYLSGGIDSSALAYFLSAQNKNSDLDTFSIAFESDEYDESAAQKVVSEALGVNHHSIKISKADLSNNFRSVINHAETLLFRTAPVPLYLLSKRVRDAGHKVVYTGEGADEILLGYDLFAETRVRRFWSRSPSSNWRPSLLKRLYNYLPQYKNSRYFSIIKDFYSGSISDVGNPFYSHLVRWSQFKQVSSFFNFSRSSKDLEEAVINELLLTLPQKFGEASSDRKAQVLEFETLLHGYLLSSQGDRMSMAHSVEGRYPFLGKEFVENMARLSDHQKSIGIKSKGLFRDAMSSFLPADIVDRPKVAYQAPEAKSFLSNSHKSAEAEFLEEVSSSVHVINHDNLKSLESKITNEYSSDRLGFRENMAYVMCMSAAQLSDLKISWSK